MKKYWKIINNNTGEVMYVKAINMSRVELYILQNLTPDWYYLCNIVEVNPDKTPKVNGDFACIATREYHVSVFEIDDDKVILNTIFKNLLREYKKRVG